MPQMIRHSDNAAATGLFSTAADQVRLMKVFAYGRRQILGRQTEAMAFGG